MPNHDDLYGHCLAPKYLERFEDRKQRTWLRLSGDGASTFVDYAHAAIEGGYLATQFFTNFSTLWLIDTDGDVLVAVEEGVDVDAKDPSESYPLPRKGIRPPDHRLGHPALVEGGSARIGGELHVRGGDPIIYIDNRSGRFGRGRTAEQLEAAAELFRKMGLQMSVDYVPLQLT